jgi:hypothetical protein
MHGMVAARRSSLVAVYALVISVCGAACGNSRNTPAAPVVAAQGSAFAQPEDSIAITNVTVVDVVSGARKTAMTVLTKAGGIAAIGRGIAVPPGAARVDGTGKFLLPGLWDMHSHHQATGAEALDLFLATGVVGTRDMGADVDFILPLRNRINRGELLGPEIFAAGPILDNRPANWPYRRHVTNAQEARAAVRDLKERGVDFIKVHDGTPREAFFAIADEAPRLGLSFAGHVPATVTVEEAADAGIRSIEHLANFRVFNDCSATEPHNAIPCQVRYDKLAAKGVWQTPTMGFFQAIPDLFSGAPLPHAEYASDSLLELTRKNVTESKLDDRALTSFRSNAKRSLTAVGALLARGSGFLAGCDGLVPGFCLHDELAWMTAAGLSPLQAIQTATINPARFLGREKTQGTIEVGKRADLVLLDADPLADIRNTRRISAVLVRGRLLSGPEIDRIVAAHKRPLRTP